MTTFKNLSTLTLALALLAVGCNDPATPFNPMPDGDMMVDGGTDADVDMGTADMGMDGGMDMGEIRCTNPIIIGTDNMPQDGLNVFSDENLSQPKFLLENKSGNAVNLVSITVSHEFATGTMYDLNYDTSPPLMYWNMFNVNTSYDFHETIIVGDNETIPLFQSDTFVVATNGNTSVTLCYF